jgi:hypothetical protein
MKSLKGDLDVCPQRYLGNPHLTTQTNNNTDRHTHTHTHTQQQRTHTHTHKLSAKKLTHSRSLLTQNLSRNKASHTNSSLAGAPVQNVFCGELEMVFISLCSTHKVTACPKIWKIDLLCDLISWLFIHCSMCCWGCR